MALESLSKKQLIKKMLRFRSLYGIGRSINKASGRLRHPLLRSYGFKGKPKVSIIGCGQFAFSTIGFFIRKTKGLIFLNCYDIDADNAKSLAHYFRFEKVAPSVEALLSNPKLEILYIASNHATHTPYAVKAMKHGLKTIYLEKPISVTEEQFVSLIAHKRKYQATLFAGYNRPYAQAIRKIYTVLDKNTIKQKDAAFSMNFFISGHQLSDDHWYRRPEEGTRICGNVGHWIDLAIHILAWRNLPKQLHVQVAYSNLEEPDDNMNITMTSDQGDLISIMLSARSEPFEGINETVNFQYQNVIAKVSDFRELTIWKQDKLIKNKFWPKDVGHKRAILQPFETENRDWSEVECSTLLMLFITQMVRQKTTSATFELESALAEFNALVAIKSKSLFTTSNVKNNAEQLK